MNLQSVNFNSARSFLSSFLSRDLHRFLPTDFLRSRHRFLDLSLNRRLSRDLSCDLDLLCDRHTLGLNKLTLEMERFLELDRFRVDRRRLRDPLRFRGRDRFYCHIPYDQLL